MGGPSEKAKGKQRAEELAPYEPPTERLSKYTYAPKTKADWTSKQRSKNAIDRRLSRHLGDLASSSKAAARKAFEHDDLLLPADNAGLLEVEDGLERTWKTTQKEIVEASGIGVADKSFELQLDQFGPYAVDYTRNGRHLAIAGRKGHIGTFDWHSSKLHTELHLNETVRSIRWLHDESFFAVAQKKYVYIYDHDGLEIHQLKSHVEVNDMVFLPYHWLLATVGNAGFLKYQDTSTGQLVSEQRTKLGACSVIAQNPQTAIVHLGHANGTVTLWSPSVPRAQVKLLAHRGPVTSCSVDQSGTKLATSGMDGEVKVWDLRNWKELEKWAYKKTPQEVKWSQKGLLGVGWGNHVTVYNSLQKTSKGSMLPPAPYISHTFSGRAVNNMLFCPFDDVLGVGHAGGFSSLIVPGSGEPNFDSLEADPFETKRRRREREVNSLLDKLPADMITLDQRAVGKLEKKEKESALEVLKPTYRPTPFAKKSRVERLELQGRAGPEDDESDGSEGMDDEDEAAAARAMRDAARVEKGDKKKRMRGKGSTLKRAMRKKNRNVVDPMMVAVKAKAERNKRDSERKRDELKKAKLKANGADVPEDILDRFRRK